MSELQSYWTCSINRDMYFGRAPPSESDFFRPGAEREQIMLAVFLYSEVWRKGMPRREQRSLYGHISIKREDARKLTFPGIIMKKLFSKQ